MFSLNMIDFEQANEKIETLHPFNIMFHPIVPQFLGVVNIVLHFFVYFFIFFEKILFISFKCDTII